MFLKNFHFLRFDHKRHFKGVVFFLTDGQTDGPTDQRTDRPTDGTPKNNFFNPSAGVDVARQTYYRNIHPSTKAAAMTNHSNNPRFEHRNNHIALASQRY